MTMDEGLIPADKWRDFWAYYKGEEQQLAGITRLYQHIKSADPSLLHENAEWLTIFRTPVEKPSGIQKIEYPNTWDGVKAAAHDAGARFPELVAAQWVLESARGTATSGKNNYFGLKGSGTTCTTWEVYGGHDVRISAGFIDFPTLGSCVDYLVSRWYRDYKGYKGVNHCLSAQEAAHELRRQGYATDPAYPEKLIAIMAHNG